MNRSQNNNRLGETLYGEGETLYAEKSILKNQSRGFVRIASVIFAFLIALLLLYFAAVALFKVRSFNIEGNAYYTSEAIQEASGIDVGRFMFNFSASDVEKRIERKCPYVKEVRISRDYPSTLNISVVEYSPEYYTTAVGKYIVLSPELKVLEVSDTDRWGGELIYLELPDISVAVEGRGISFQNEENPEYILHFVSALSEYSPSCKITRVALKESFSIKLYCENAYEVLLGKSDDMSLKLRTLSKILSSDKLKEEPRARIDLTDPKEPSFVPIYDE